MGVDIKNYTLAFENTISINNITICIYIYINPISISILKGS